MFTPPGSSPRPNLVRITVICTGLLVCWLIFGGAAVAAAAPTPRPADTTIDTSNYGALVAEGTCSGAGGADGLSVVGSDLTIFGNLVSNGDINLNGATGHPILVHGDTTATAGVYPPSSTSTVQYYGTVTGDAAAQTFAPPWNIADFQPGGAIATAAGSFYHSAPGSVTSWSSFNNNASTYPPGIYFANGDVTLGSSQLTSHAPVGVTLVATGTISVSTSGSTAWTYSPFDLGNGYPLPLMFAMGGPGACSSSSATYAINISGGGNRNGALYAPNGRVSLFVPGAGSFNGSIIGLQDDISGSSFSVTYDASQLPTTTYPPPAAPRTYTVNSADDTDDGLCNSFHCSLREAINAANANAGADTIAFNIAGGGVQTITLGSQLPDITSDVTITGNGAANTIVQANASPNVATYRVFYVGSTGSLTLNSLTVRNGVCNGSCVPGMTSYGGGIFNDGTLILNASTVGANSAVFGGGIVNNLNATMTLTGSRLLANTATTLGAAISSYGAASITGSCIVGNNGLAYDAEATAGQMATGNWWGNAGGPGPVATGGGDTVGPSVDTSGFLTTPILGCPTNPAPATITVNSSADGDLPTLNGNVTCDLREAITNANADDQSGSTACASGSGVDTITFDPSTDGNPITLTSRLPTITSPMIITGHGTASTIIQASTCNPITLPGGCTPAAYNVLQVGQMPGTGILRLNSLTIRYGRCTGSVCSDGGGIDVFNGALTLNASAVKSNKVSGSGGGIATMWGQLAIENGSIVGGAGSGNSASTHGGGIYGNWDTTVDASTVSANTAGDGGGIYNYGFLTVQNGSLIGGPGVGNSAGDGGGIANAATTTIDASTVSANTATFRGGGIFSLGNGLFLTVRNGSIIGGAGAGNSAGQLGGGIFNSAGTLTVTASTIRANTATTSGGGVYSDSLAVPVSTTGSCILGNSSVAVVNTAAAIQTATGNWWGDPSGPNPPGSGDTISGNWDTSGYLTAAPVQCNGGPFNLSATVISQTQIDLSWTDAATDETSFRVERSDNGSTGWAEIGSTAADATSYSDTTLACGQTRYYRVRARNAGGDSSPSNTSSATTASCLQTGPTFTVNTSADSDDTCDLVPRDCSLREAINAANAHSGADTIAFNIPGADAHTITVTDLAGLPPITEAVTIDGTTQPGASCAAWPPTLMIEVQANGPSILTSAASNVTIKGLALSLGNVGLTLSSSATSNSITCNYIGATTSGALQIPLQGIVVNGSNNTIGGTDGLSGNLIVPSLEISGASASYNQVEGNFIGTNADGSAALCPACTGHGVTVHGGASHTTIGGSLAGARNIISGFNNNTTGAGVYVSGASDTVIQHNYIGANAAGTSAIPNRLGVWIDTPAATTTNTQILGNLLSGNRMAGVYVTTGSGDTTVISGNEIGTTASGLLPLPNGNASEFFGVGILIAGAQGSQISSNLIAYHTLAANEPAGVSLSNATLSASSGNCIYGNTTGLFNFPDNAVTFANNWWGSSTGPTIDSNPGGIGDSINGTNVAYSPFLTSAPSACAEFFPPVVSLSASSINLGSAIVGQSSAAQLVTVTNTGEADLTIGALGRTGSTDFSLSGDNCSNQTIPPVSGNACTFEVTFSPSSAGAKSGSITIPSNALTSPDHVTMSGFGLAAALPPALSAPKDGAAVYTFLPKFAWKGIKGATGYHIEIDDDPDFGSPIGADTVKNAYATSPDSLLTFGTYFWHVNVTTPDGTTAYSLPRSFDVTLLKSPRKNAAIATHTPKFSWQKVTGASYWLKVYATSKEADCTNDAITAVIDQSGLLTPSYAQPSLDLLPLGTYYWHVSPDGGTTWTPCWRFELTTLKTPKFGSTVSTFTPKFGWAPDKLATGYDLTVTNVDTSASFTRPSLPVASYQSVIGDGLDFGKYLWRVQEIGGAPYMPDTTPDGYFYITIMTAPRNSLFTLKPVVTFSWKPVFDAVKGVTTYHVEVNTQPDFLGTAIWTSSEVTAFKVVSPSLARGVYFWHVVSSNGHTMPAWTFTVGP